MEETVLEEYHEGHLDSLSLLFLEKLMFGEMPCEGRGPRFAELPMPVPLND